jgi:type III pantothenate kinase
MMLLLDVGNTNIKAAVMDDDRMTPIGSVEHRSLGLGPALSAGQRISGTIDRVVVCCVAGPAVRRELEAAIRSHFDLEAEFVTAQRKAFGVTNAYPEAHRLGADRWAGLIGAHARGYEAACIVDAGSALTVDGLSSGRHIGGLIAPGIGLMQAALFSETGNLRQLSEEPLEGGMGLFATDTHESIVRGTILAAASLIQRSRKEMAGLIGKLPSLVISGGDAERLIPLLDEYVDYHPHLTLEGLAVIAKDGPVE